MAAAVLRKRKARPMPINPRRARNAPVMRTARTTPGWSRLAVGAPPPDSTAWPRKNDAKLRTSPTTSIAPPATAALPASSSGRRGVADREARIVPLEYSALTTRMPNTPIVSSPTNTPPSVWLVGSKPGYQSNGWWAAWLADRYVIRVVAATVMARVHHVERRVVVLSVSARATCLNP